MISASNQCPPSKPSNTSPSPPPPIVSKIAHHRALNRGDPSSHDLSPPQMATEEKKYRHGATRLHRRAYAVYRSVLTTTPITRLFLALCAACLLLLSIITILASTTSLTSEPATTSPSRFSLIPRSYFGECSASISSLVFPLAHSSGPDNPSGALELKCWDQAGLGSPEATHKGLAKGGGQLKDWASSYKRAKEKHGGRKNANRPKYAENDILPEWVDAGEDKIPLRYARTLQYGASRGHTFKQLKEISAVASFTVTQTPENGQTVSVTVVLNLQQSADLKPQLDAILAQSLQVEAVWVVCTLKTEKAAHGYISKYRHSNKIEVIVIDNDRFKHFGWVQVAQDATSEFVWLIDDGVVPGLRYMETLLRLANTEEYRDAALGTQGAVLPSRESNGLLDSQDLVCMPDPVESGEMASVTQPVDMLNHIWFIRREWVPFLLRDARDEARNVPLGFLIAHSLRHNADIPSIILPTDPIDTTVWGDTRSSSELEASCKQIKEQFRENTYWRRFLGLGHPLTVDYKRIPSTRSNRNVVFFVDGVRQARVLQPLFCRFAIADQGVVHIIVTGAARGVSAQQVTMSLKKKYPSCAGVRTYDLNIRYGVASGLPSDDVANVLAQTVHGMDRVLRFLKPRVMIRVAQDRNPAVRGAEMAGKLLDVVDIGLPANEVRHALWMSDLPLETIEKWNDFKIQLIVITDKRPHSLSRLLRSINHAHYLGDEVAMSVNMEQTADKVTRLFVSTFPWVHGPKNVRHRIRKGGLMPAIVEAWYPSENNDYAIFLEDDVEVSPLFYVWVKFAILRYRYGPDRESASLMFGVSLYSPRNTEMGIEGRRPFHPDWVLNATKHHLRTPYLLQVPCSWGAVYFPEHWREYHDYVTARLVDIDNKNLQNITIPDARSNRWYNSWKRYFIEMIYLRGYVMLYPNFLNFTSFSTNHLEFGTHVKHKRTAIDQFLVPLMERDTILSELPQNRLPGWDALPVLDLWAHLQSISVLKERGLTLHKQVSACLVQEIDTDLFDPQDLLCPYPRKKDETTYNGTYPAATATRIPVSQPVVPVTTVYVYITVAPQPDGQVVVQDPEEYALPIETPHTSITPENIPVVEPTDVLTAPEDVPNKAVEEPKEDVVPVNIEFETKPIDPSEDGAYHEEEDQETLDLEEDLANMDRLEKERQELEEQYRGTRSNWQEEVEQPLSVEDIMGIDAEYQEGGDFDWDEEDEEEEEEVVAAGEEELHLLMHPTEHRDKNVRGAGSEVPHSNEAFVKEEGNGDVAEEEMLDDENMDMEAVLRDVAEDEVDFGGEEDGGQGKLLEPVFVISDDAGNRQGEPDIKRDGL